MEDPTDNHLISYLPALKWLAKVEDVREIIGQCITADNLFLLDKCESLCEQEIEHRNREKE